MVQILFLIARIDLSTTYLGLNLEYEEIQELKQAKSQVFFKSWSLQRKTRFKSLFLITKKNAMNIQAEKIELVKLLLDTENSKIIESIKEIFEKEKISDF